MLRAFIKVCKNIKTGYDPALKPVELDAAKASCPSCHAKGTITRHSCYLRNYVSADGENVTDCTIEITRVKCASCKKTHAVLPLTVIPYSPFSVLFVAWLVIDYNNGRFSSVERLCAYYHIAMSSCYRLLERFGPCVRLALGSTAGKADAVSYAVALATGAIESIDNVLGSFFEMTGMSFCQSRSP